MLHIRAAQNWKQKKKKKEIAILFHPVIYLSI